MADPVIFIVEDDAVIAELLEFNLQGAGYSVVCFREGQSLFQNLDKPDACVPDLFVLDLMLPGMDGFEICRKLRQIDRLELVPVLMLTARGSESDKVRGLEIGADDYLTKPFGMRELLARVQALIRRYHKMIDRIDEPAETDFGAAAHPGGPARQASNPIRPSQMVCGDLLLDDTRHRVYKGDQEIEMTHREYELLKFLMANRGVAYSRDDLLNYVWGYEYSGETRTVDVHIRQLRRKLETDDANPVLIETVRGRGYRFADQIR
jgi:two-component system alkaline phosphatase synthesis response regulator PhoP